MGLLTKEAILAANDLKTEVVQVPEWGGEVMITTMTAAAKDDYEQSLVNMVNGQARENLSNIRAKLVAACLVDEEGNRLFSSKEIEQLGSKSGKAMDRVFEAASRLNAISQDDIDELAKNY